MRGLEALTLVRSTWRRVKTAARVVRFRPESEMSASAQLERWAKSQPDHPCITFEDRIYTYADVNAAVDARCVILQRAGIGRGDVVCLMMGNRPAFLMNAWALNRLGAVAALINISLRGSGLKHAVTIVKPKGAIVDGPLVAPFEDALSELCTDGDLRVWVDCEESHDEPVPEYAEDLSQSAGALGRGAKPAMVTLRGTDLMAFIYTSGTTGLPKAGRIINARAQLAAMGFGGVLLGLGPWDVVYCCLPLFHSNGFLIASGSVLYSGSTLALARRFSASRFWEDVARYRATVFVYIGEVCRYLVGQPPHPDERRHRLRKIVGNGLRPEVWTAFVERFQPGRVHEFYAATEGNVAILNLTGRVGSVGKLPPLKRMNNALLVKFDHETQLPHRDANGHCMACDVGEVGELLGRIDKNIASSRFDGYASPEATRNKLLHDVKERGDAYFRTGDLLRQDEGGYFYFVDRIGDTFRWKGENVSTNEVGDVAAGFPGVEISNVYGVKVPNADGRAGMAALVMSEGESFDPEAFYTHVSSVLPAYAQPAFVRLAGVMSLTATFKLRKVDLVKDGFDPHIVQDRLFYRSDEQRTYLPLDEIVYARIKAGELRV